MKLYSALKTERTFVIGGSFVAVFLAVLFCSSVPSPTGFLIFGGVILIDVAIVLSTYRKYLYFDFYEEKLIIRGGLLGSTKSETSLSGIKKIKFKPCTNGTDKDRPTYTLNLYTEDSIRVIYFWEDVFSNYYHSSGADLFSLLKMNSPEALQETLLAFETECNYIFSEIERRKKAEPQQ